MDRYVITIGRQFGSGGRSIGEKLAKKLNIAFYDKELISIAAKESGMDPEVFEGVDEKAANSLLYSLSMGMYSFGSGFSAMGDLPVNDKLYLLQHKIIKEKAEEKADLPKLYFACGDQDPIAYQSFKAFRAFAKEIGLDAKFFELPGYSHEWRFWDLCLQDALARFIVEEDKTPLFDPTE